MVPHHVLIRRQERLLDAADAHKPTIVLGQTGVNTEMTVSLATQFSLFTRWCSSLPAAARDHLVGAYFTQQQPGGRRRNKTRLKSTRARERSDDRRQPGKGAIHTVPIRYTRSKKYPESVSRTAFIACPSQSRRVSSTTLKRRPSIEIRPRLLGLTDSILGQLVGQCAARKAHAARGFSLGSAGRRQRADD